MSITLTLDELRGLTGLRQAKRIEHWLGSRGWVFEPALRRGAIPAVARSYFDARMSGQLKVERKSRLKLERM